MTLRIGVIGLGVGRVHLDHFHALDGVEIAAVADVDASLATSLGARYGAAAYVDALELLDAQRLDAVTVRTPPKFHASLVVAAIERGMHVLCEKPMAPTLADCDRMIAVAERAGVTLMLGFKKRYAPAYSLLKERAAEWGPPRTALVRYQLGPVDKAWFWDEADGGGPLVENACHALDTLRYLFGDVETVYAETTRHFSRNADADISEAVFTLRFRGGGTAAVAAGMAGVWAYDEAERLSFAYDDRIVEVYGPFDLPGRMRVMERDGADVVLKTWREPSGFREQFEAFAACVRGEATPRATGIDGRRALELGLAVKQSGRTGQPVAPGADGA